MNARNRCLAPMSVYPEDSLANVHQLRASGQKDVIEKGVKVQTLCLLPKQVRSLDLGHRQAALDE
jgi:hypothetical protein